MELEFWDIPQLLTLLFSTPGYFYEKTENPPD